VALVYLSHIKKKMRDSGSCDKWTLKSLLDELNMIELFGAPGQERSPGEVTKKQKDIYAEPGIPAPPL